eukprot:COSAG02_NODE_6191_length_3741_cov_8.726249_3_plen_58_part_00
MATNACRPPLSPPFAPRYSPRHPSAGDENDSAPRDATHRTTPLAASTLYSDDLKELK